MKNKANIIFHADDFGLTKGFNKGIEIAFNDGVLNSTCIRTNGPFFEEAINKTLPKCKNLSVGLHLNLVEGKSHLNCNLKSNLICENSGDFKYKFLGLFFRSFNKKFLLQVEEELRCQFEIAHKNLIEIDHINSHQHCCSIPSIFNISCKLAKEYNVKYVRIPNEKFFIQGNILSHLSKSYISNFIKWMILKFFSYFNKKIANEYNLQYPDSFIGILYTGKMDTEKCIKAIDNIKKYKLVEILLHPSELIGDLEEKYLSKELRDYCLSRYRRKELKTLISLTLKTYLFKNNIKTTNFNQSFEKKNLISALHSYERKKVFLIIDETNFYHPDLLDNMALETDTFNIVGVGIVKLGQGGVLQRHLLKNILNVGVSQIFKLALKSIFIKLNGIISEILNLKFNYSCKQVASNHNLNFKIVNQVNNLEFKQWIKTLNPEFIISSNSLIFDEELINIPTQYCINRHSSLLPSNAGIFPVFRSLLNNHTHTGVTIHAMTKQIDEGKVLSQFAIPIFPGDTLTLLYKFCFNISYALILDVVTNFDAKTTNLNNSISIPFPKSYHTYPTPEEWKKFKSKGLKFL